VKRILVSDVLAAYKATGLKPSQQCGSRWAGEGMACGLGAVAAATIDVPQWKGHALFSWRVEWLAERLGLKSSYVYGFADSFDGDDRTPHDSFTWWDEEEYDQGYADGQAAAAAVFAEAKS
jgi:hypothetical protein